MKNNIQVKHITIVGGTHGNELHGIHLVKNRQANRYKNRDKLNVKTLLANPLAIEANRRYIETDLNRCFKLEDLNDESLSLKEQKQAREIAQELGGQDLVIDLHNTTANMGLTIILLTDRGIQDPFMVNLLFYLQKKEPQVYILNRSLSANESPYLSSLGKQDLAIEVGPVPHGTLYAELFVKTEALIEHILDFLEEPQALSGTLTYYQHLFSLDYPRDESGEICAMIHPDLQGRDYQPLKPGDPLFLKFDGETIANEQPGTLWPVFINEQAYYEKGVALTFTKKEQLIF